jgi:exosortase
LTESASTTSPKGISRAHFALAGIALFALWFVLCRHLSGEWSVNEQYSYGWFVPFFAIFLFWLRWEDRPEVGGQRSEVGRQRWIAIAVAAAALLILLPVRLFEVANPDWRPVGWVHMAAVAALTLLVIWAAGGKPWLRHFAFPICFFFVAVPWVSPIEEPIVQGLMRTVAAVATEAITLFGVPAQLEGNLIRVSTGLVGVNEACSGVRSLQTSLMIGLLFGELKRLSIAKRVVLVLGALAIAVIANFARAFFLVWVAATESVSAVERWHDAAGYTIVAVVFIGSLLLAAVLGRNRKGERRKAKGENETSSSDLRPPTSDLRSPFPFRLCPFLFLLCFAWLLAIEIGVETWYRINEKKMSPRLRWTVQWPESVPGFRDLPIDSSIKNALRFDEGREGSWPLSDERLPPDSAPRSAPSMRASVAHCTLFFFRWKPGATTILRARAHRPDICLPSAGWRQTADHGVRDYSARKELALPFRHFTFLRSFPGQPDLFAEAFFCMHEDSVRAEENSSARFDPNSRRPTDWVFADRYRVVREGLRNPGQQVMEVIFITGKEIGGADAETKFAALLPGLVEAR